MKKLDDLFTKHFGGLYWQKTVKSENFVEFKAAIHQLLEEAKHKGERQLAEEVLGFDEAYPHTPKELLLELITKRLLDNTGVGLEANLDKGGTL